MKLVTESGKSVAVIGGGISGLAAAHRISELDPQVSVTLFERFKSKKMIKKLNIAMEKSQKQLDELKSEISLLKGEAPPIASPDVTKDQHNVKDSDVS